MTEGILLYLNPTRHIKDTGKLSMDESIQGHVSFVFVVILFVSAAVVLMIAYRDIILIPQLEYQVHCKNHDHASKIELTFKRKEDLSKNV